jgi:hypothetical protein
MKENLWDSRFGSGAGSCHSRENGNPEGIFVLDSHFRGNDNFKLTEISYFQTTLKFFLIL